MTIMQIMAMTVEKKHTITRTLLKDLGADVLVCSAYKFFGPHLGLMAFNKERLSSLQPSKVLIVLRLIAKTLILVKRLAFGGVKEG